MEADREASFLQSVCLPFLRKAQNTDGGWGFHTGAASRAEPTCWALFALMNSPGSADEAVNRGFQFLRAAQLADGSWPPTPGQNIGSWVTSLACWALLFRPHSAKAVGAGLEWLCNDWPRDSTPWRRFLSRLSSHHEIFPINTSYRGWGWTPRTSSWVEPTSFALLALERAPADLRPPVTRRRRQLAEALLYDRMCPAGGWNSGNPSVYGVAGEPLVGPTACALLALRAYPRRPENVLSLDWLERGVGSIGAAGSLALARICLEAYGRVWPDSAPKFSDFQKKNAFLENVQVVAWVCLALSPQRSWLDLTSVTTS
jgi:Squalene-hopene cyclase C-terminal domain